MAIVQISQITNRKGLNSDLPQLAGAELGWSTDTRQLYIGNGTLEDGAPVIGNTEILTEFSDILGVANTYTYKGQAAGYTVQTSANGTPVTNSVQAILDQYASVLDFGAVGDGVTDCTQAINWAMYQLYCRQPNPQIRRSLFFPAGVYLVSGPINIPSYATLYGEGPENSIIYRQPKVVFTGTILLTTLTVDSVIEGAIAPGQLIYGLGIAPGTTIVSQLTTNQWQVSVSQVVTAITTITGGIGGYVAQLADSLQQTGYNIALGGATAPTSITIQNMGFQSADPSTGIMLVEAATNCQFQNATFTGPGTVSSLFTDADSTAAVSFSAPNGISNQQILFDNCRFSGTTWGVYNNINSDLTTRGVSIQNSAFDLLYQGVNLVSGATGFRTVANTFDNIYAEGIVFGAVSSTFTGTISGNVLTVSNVSAGALVVGQILTGTNVLSGTQITGFITGTGGTGTYQVSINQTLSTPTVMVGAVSQSVSLNASGQNIFYDVGNHFTGKLNPYTSIIDIQQSNNISISDMFERADSYATVHPRVNLNNSTSIATTNGSQLSMGTYTRESGLAFGIGYTINPVTIFAVDVTQTLAFSFEYTISRNGAFRTGKVTVSPNGLTADLNWDDVYSENEDAGVLFSITQTSNIVTVAYTSPSVNTQGTMYYSITYLA